MHLLVFTIVDGVRVMLVVVRRQQLCLFVTDGVHLMADACIVTQTGFFFHDEIRVICIVLYSPEIKKISLKKIILN